MQYIMLSLEKRQFCSHKYLNILLPVIRKSSLQTTTRPHSAQVNDLVSLTYILKLALNVSGVMMSGFV